MGLRERLSKLVSEIYSCDNSPKQEQEREEDSKSERSISDHSRVKTQQSSSRILAQSG
jgi:hypothetical protein